MTKDINVKANQETLLTGRKGDHMEIKVNINDTSDQSRESSL